MSSLIPRRLLGGAVGACVAGALIATAALPVAAVSQPPATAELLTDPFLQLPGEGSVHVVWNAEFSGTHNVVLVGEGVGELTVPQARAAATGEVPDGVAVFTAETSTYSRLVEDAASRLPDGERPSEADGIVDRTVYRHEAVVTGLAEGRTPYRVVSLGDDQLAVSDAYTLAPAPAPGTDLRILLTSDHQAMVNTPANLQKAAETLGRIDAVFFAGDLVNQPDRASEWFDDTRGGAFFPVLQGNAGRASSAAGQPPADEDVYRGGEIIQHAPLFPAVGNHEVQGRIDGHTSIGASYNNAVPREVAEAVYETVADEVNPTGDPEVRSQWIEDNSFSTTTYEEMFTLPDDSPGGETYYATTIGDVRLVSLYSTRIWRGTAATPDPAQRTGTSRYQEATANLDDPLAQGHGEFVFESLAEGSEQLEWLKEEVRSEEFRDAELQVVMLHEGPQGLGDNVMPHFAEPVRIEETDDAGDVVGVRYEYPAEENMLLRDVQPVLEEAGVDLVYNGHSHLWNRFLSESGTNYLESSNTGNTYGAYDASSGATRPVPPEPWVRENYVAQGNPGGLAPVVPTIAPMTDDDGTALPFVSSNDHAIFAVLDTGSEDVTTYSYDVRTPDVDPVVIDRFPLGDGPQPEPEPEPQPEQRHGFFLTNGWDGGDADYAFTYGRHTDEVLIGDWDGDGTDSITVRRDDTYYVNNAPRGGPAVKVFTYGRADDVVLVGDWDGDGTDTLAVRRDATYHVKNSLRGGDADRVVVYGRAGDDVMVGDWDGDGADTFAVRRGASYHVKNRISGGDADVTFSYGREADVTLAGDWDGDGRDTFAVRRGKVYHVSNALRGGDAEQVMRYGREDDEVYVGDWDSDGRDTIGVRRTPQHAS